ncbi:MAG: PASTA domain-containing protein [Clostridiales Family XIII bacterium]|jgi:stage V sporulation protein D (sporulation-specific penicillin-binding protein)|nr:PASTA domain-containing protein [Clostridiales Family XIII bacterium]
MVKLRSQSQRARSAGLDACVRLRLIIFFAFIALLFAGLAFRIGWITVIANDKYAKLAHESQTRDVLIPARRGGIYDRNMTELAVSAVSYRVWARPANVAYGDSEELRELRFEKTARMLSEELGLDAEAVREMLRRDNVMVRIANNVSEEQIAAVEARVKGEKLKGIEIEQYDERYYPYGPFAAHVLGVVDDDSRGMSGAELAYEKDLTGIAGRWIKNADPNGNSLAYGAETRYDAQNGLNVVLTIDEAIQHYVEKAIGKAQEVTGALRVMAVVMDPKTGDILGMGVTPDFDPNDPRVPLDPAAAEYVRNLLPEEQVEYRNGMWRNPLIGEVYDPGSTFKLLTVAAALEERVTRPDDRFRCDGYYTVADQRLRCWRYYDPHGNENLTQAVGNSCNPVMIQLVQRMGYDRFYKYIELFGITSRTGIDLPGETNSLVQDRATAGPVGLATMSFGQGISITPIQLVTAVSAIGSGGELMRPRLVKALADDEGNIVQSFDAQVVRRVLSEQTAEEVRDIMEYVVNESGGSAARIPGYRIGGKTGTAEKLDNGSYKTGKVMASMIALAPMDDPRLAVLAIVDEPQGIKFGSTTAAPVVKDILSDALRYMNIAPRYTQAELAAMQQSQIIVPNVTGMSFSDAAGKLLGSNLLCVSSPAGSEDVDFTVVDQYPKAGDRLPPGGRVCLYGE